MSVGTDKVMEVSSAKPGDVIQSKEDDDEDNDDDDDDDLVDTGMWRGVCARPEAGIPIRPDNCEHLFNSIQKVQFY